jgi:hypothetical protein
MSAIVYNPPPPALSINNRGSIIGCYSASNVVSGFVRFEDGTLTTLKHAGSKQTIPTAINNSDVITGSYSDGTDVVGFILRSQLSPNL